MTFAVMLVVGLITGQLTAGLRFQARVATHREARSRSLFETARDLSNTLTHEHAVEIARVVIRREFRAWVAVYVLAKDDRLQAPQAADAELEGLDPGTAQWVLDHTLPAGLGSDTLAGSAWMYLPLKTPMRTRGVLALRPEVPRLLLVPGQRQQLETFAALTAMALERVHYVQMAQSATVQMASERLRNSLLAALSHDLRTPLAALVGLAELLAASPPALSAAQQGLATSIRERALRMTEMVTNLLDMARIQSAEIRLRIEWQSMEVLIASALKLTQGSQGERAIAVEIGPGAPLVQCDAVLIERVLVNLLENATKYTPPGTAMDMVVRPQDGQLQVSVRDHGPGVSAGKEALIFEKFTRGDNESATLRMGLGQAICRAIVEAHQGQINVTPTPPSGATFSFSLPLAPAPKIDTADSTDIADIADTANHPVQDTPGR